MITQKKERFLIDSRWRELNPSQFLLWVFSGNAKINYSVEYTFEKVYIEYDIFNRSPINDPFLLINLPDNRIALDNISDRNIIREKISNCLTNLDVLLLISIAKELKDNKTTTIINDNDDKTNLIKNSRVSFIEYLRYILIYRKLSSKEVVEIFKILSEAIESDNDISLRSTIETPATFYFSNNGGYTIELETSLYRLLISMNDLEFEDFKTIISYQKVDKYPKSFAINPLNIKFTDIPLNFEESEYIYNNFCKIQLYSDEVIKNVFGNSNNQYTVVSYQLRLISYCIKYIKFTSTMLDEIIGFIKDNYENNYTIMNDYYIMSIINNLLNYQKLTPKRIKTLDPIVKIIANRSSEPIFSDSFERLVFGKFNYGLNLFNCGRSGNNFIKAGLICKGNTHSIKSYLKHTDLKIYKDYNSDFIYLYAKTYTYDDNIQFTHRTFKNNIGMININKGTNDLNITPSAEINGDALIKFYTFDNLNKNELLDINYDIAICKVYLNDISNIVKGKMGISVNEIESIYADKAEVVGIFRASKLYDIDHKFLEDKLNYQSMFNNLRFMIIE